MVFFDFVLKKTKKSGLIWLRQFSELCCVISTFEEMFEKIYDGHLVAPFEFQRCVHSSWTNKGRIQFFQMICCNYQHSSIHLKNSIKGFKKVRKFQITFFEHIITIKREQFFRFSSFSRLLMLGWSQLWILRKLNWLDLYCRVASSNARY